jgi:DNA-binding NtrC family response regulator
MAFTNRHLLLSVIDSTTQSKLQRVAQDLGIRACFELSPEAVLKNPELRSADCVVFEFREFGPSSFRWLDACRQIAPDVRVLAVLHNPTPADALRFSRGGAFECLASSSSTQEFLSVIHAAQSHANQLRNTQTAISEEPWKKHLVGNSAPMERVSRIIRLVAARRCTVLITGETGTGKEMVARAIHLASNRARRPMVCVNCSAIPENLIEAELFGHVKGAYTGAVGSRAGRFEQANGGTLFLDEIADLPFELQSKLLRALQEKEIQRLGSSETIKVDVRVIAATNADLLARVEEGRFREDLFYRLNVVPIQMPALRERTSDIAPLIEHFILKICEAEGIPAKRLETGAIAPLSAYYWPGNVRQLENVVEHAVVMSGEREILRAADFVLPVTKSMAGTNVHEQLPRVTVPAPVPACDLPDEGLDFTETLRQFERALLHQAMTRAQGNKTLAADMLKLPRTTLIHKLRVLDQAVA